MSEDKVVSLKGDPIVQPGTIRPDLVGALEELLEAAKAGELEGFSGALLYRDGSTSYRINGHRNRTLLGTIAMMQYYLCYEDYMECK